MKLKLYLLMFIFLDILLVSCSNNSLITLPDADEITKLGDTCTALETMQVDAWKTFDPEEVRKVYTDDIVHFDGHPAYVGIDEIVDMSKMIFRNFSKWQMDVGTSYISQDGCVGTWMNWNIFGGTLENPAKEFDVLTARDGKISYWRLLYDESFKIGMIQKYFLSDYVSAWNSGHITSVKDFYAENAVLEDTLLGVSVQDMEGIENYVKSYQKLSPQMEWELLVPFIEQEAGYAFRDEYPHPSTGGVFGIHVTDTAGNDCMIETFLILTPDDDGKIIDHQTFYNEETLIECGWTK